MRLLHLDSSAHPGQESVSRRLTAAFAQTWRAGRRGAEYCYHDLVASPVAPIGPAFCALGRRLERRHPAASVRVEDLIETDEEQREWDLTRPLIDQLLASDVLLVGAPMYNYSAPAALKAWIDRVSVPGVFACSSESPLLADLQVIVASSCGGAYGPGTGASQRDFLTPYLRAYFAKQGVAPDNIEVVVADRTLAGVVPGREHLLRAAARSAAAAHDRLIRIAKRTSAAECGHEENPSDGG